MFTGTRGKDYSNNNMSFLKNPRKIKEELDQVGPLKARGLNFAKICC
jgi:hypothetical protein